MLCSGHQPHRGKKYCEQLKQSLHMSTGFSSDSCRAEKQKLACEMLCVSALSHLIRQQGGAAIGMEPAAALPETGLEVPPAGVAIRNIYVW